jgi:uncharacterized protein YfiM (DUF2279 family)
MDKMHHFTYCLALAVLAAAALKLAGSPAFPLKGAYVAVYIGLIKEVWDFHRKGNLFSLWDLAADLAGAATGAVAILIIAT